MALKFIFNPFPSNPFKISSSSSQSPSLTRTLLCSFNPNLTSSSSFPRKHISAKIPARDRIIHFGKHKGQMLGTLPSDYLKWVSKNLITEDSKEWGKLADEVLEDPVYKDRIEWEFAEAVMTGDRGAAIRRTEDPHDRLIEISERFGWDFDDRIGWGRVDFALLGTSKGGRIPRKGSSSSSTSGVSEIGIMGSLNEESKVRRGRKLGFLSKRGSKVPVVEADEVMGDRVRGSREERRERRRLKRGLQLHKVKVEISGMKNKEEDEDEDDENVESTPSKLFPGRESLLKKAQINRKRL